MKTTVVWALFVTGALAHLGDHHHPHQKRSHLPTKQNWIKRRASSIRRQLGQAALLALDDDEQAPATVYNGTALWFNQTGAISACHTYPSNDDMIIGLPVSLYNATGTPSPLCGQSVFVTDVDTGKNATLLVADASGNDYVTLSIAAFRAIGPNLRIGEINVSYYFPNAASGSDSNNASGNSLLGSGIPLSASNYIAAAQPTLTVIASTDASSQTITSAVSSKAQPTTPPSDAAAQSAAAAAAAQSAAAAASAQAAQQASQAAASSQQAAQAAAAAASSKEAAQAAAAASASQQAAQQAAASSSKAAAAAAASQQAQQEAADAAAASASSSAAAAAASKKAQQQQAAAAAAASSSSAAAAAASAQAQQQQQNNNNNKGNGGGGGGGSWVTGGYATFFYQNGVAGACGNVNPDSALIVAQDSRMYNGGSNCGKQVKIIRTDTGASVTATIADECPTCDNAQCLDLSVGAFKAIATEDEGQVPIKYEYV